MQEWDGISVLSHNTTLSGDVGILFTKSFSPVLLSSWLRIVKGRLLKIRTIFDKICLCFCLCLCSNISNAKIGVFRCTSSTLQTCSTEDYLFLGGDLIVLKKILSRNHIEPHMPSRERLTKMINVNVLCDILRHFHDGQRQYTWAHARDNVLSLARLDRFYGFKHQLGILKVVSFHIHTVSVFLIIIWYWVFLLKSN